MPRKLNKY